jgi:hypothetical protein
VDGEDDEDDEDGALPANSLFEFFHLGGDEVQYPCWNASAAIRVMLMRVCVCMC